MQSMKTYTIEIRGLTKSYGKLRAVNNLNLRIEKGIYGLIGPNGAGKTTTIKCMLGVLKADSGEIFVLGKRMPSKEILKDVGYMPQELAVYLDLTVYENLRFFAKLYGLKSSVFSRYAKEIMRLLELVKWKDTLILNLSGGLQRRVSLACALLHKPKLLVLDEPTVGIDPKLRAEFWEYFHKLAKEEDRTILLTTHYLDEAKKCDKVGFIFNGRLIAEGDPSQLVRKVKASDLEEAFLKFLEVEKA